MSNQSNLIGMIKAISGQSNVLTIPRIFVDLTKSHRAALLLSQCVYWSDKTKDPQGWFYKTFPEWHAELGIPRGGVETAMKAITAWVETKVARVSGHPKTHYRVNFHALETSISNLLESSTLEMPESSTLNLPENSRLSYTKTTTKTTTPPRDTPARMSREESKDLDALFSEILGQPIPDPQTKKDRLAAGAAWWTPIREMQARANGTTEAIARAALDRLTKNGMTVSSPRSLVKTFLAICAERERKSTAKPEFKDY